MVTVKVISVGNSLGVVLPREILARLRLDKGDVLHLLETPDGVLLTPYTPEFAVQAEAVEGVAHDERNLLRRLARDVD